MIKIEASYHQERLWFVDKFESNYLYKSSPVYHNLPLVIDISGSIDSNLLEQSFQLVINKHEVLRTKIISENDRPVQVIYEENDFKLAQEDFVSSDRNSADVSSQIENEINCPFILDLDFLIRAKLFKLSEDKHVLVVTFHHLIVDRYSLKLFYTDLYSFYESKMKGRIVHLEKLPVYYADFAQWQKNMEPKALKSLLLYWKRKLNGKLQPLEIPSDQVREHVHIFKEQSVKFDFSLSLNEKIRSYSYKYNVASNVLLLAVFNILLHKYSNLEEINIGTSFPNRSQQDLHDVVGAISNLVVLRSFINSSDTLQDVISDVRKNYEEADKYHSMPFDKLVLELNPEKDMSRTALFDILFQYEKVNQQSIQINDTIFEVVQMNSGVGKYDLNLLIQEGDNSFHGILTYNALYYNQSTIQRFINCFFTLLEKAIADPAVPISSFSIVSEAESNLILNGLNTPSVGFPKLCIQELFEAQVDKYSDHTGLVSDEVRLTYKQLNELSNQLAHYLRLNYDIVPNDLIAIKLDRNEWMVIAMLAVLKSGAAYVPIDPEYPQDRIDYMVDDCKSKLVIDNNELERFGKDKESYAKINPVCLNKPDDLCYVIYTSGTTGLPKGTLIEHRNVIRLFKNDSALFDFNDFDTWTMFHSYCFDFSVWEMYGALLFGGKLVIVPKLTAQDSKSFLSLLTKERVTILNQTPSAFYNLLKQDFASKAPDITLRMVIFGGEALSPGRLKEWVDYYPHVKMINMYGITETTVHVTYKEITQSDINNNAAGIGKAIPTLSCYVLDDHQRMLPFGIPGELYVGGDGVARGYLNRKDLTEERFIQNPFKLNDRLYRSGDKVIMKENGEMDYLGRIDDQVKIRGYRIELGEIENVLRACSSVKEAIVLAKDNSDGEKFLTAYLISDEQLNISDIRAHLSHSLPSYMIPAYYVQLDHLPLTVNGKLDKKALPDSQDLEMITGVEYKAPSTEAEHVLVSIYEEVLQKHPLGIKEDFFVLGGDSIKSIQIVSRLQQKGYSISIREIMQYPIIEDLAVRLKNVTRIASQGKIEGIVPLSPIQLYYLDREQPYIHHYNQSILLISKSTVSVPGIERCLAKIMEHHDVLRMVYKKINQKWIQENKMNSGCSVEVIDIETEQEFVFHCERVQSSFNLDKGPLFKVVVFKGLDNAGDRLLLVAHHLVIDGVSWRILLEDLSALYEQYTTGLDLKLPLKTDSFKYWQEHQLKYSESKELEKEKEYWTDLSKVQVENVPLDFQDGQNLVRDEHAISFTLNENFTNLLLTQCHQAYGTEVKDILLTGLVLSIKEVFEIKKLFIHLEGHGREQMGESDVDVSRTIGWFTSMYPFIVECNSDPEPIQELLSIKNRIASIPNQGIGYGILRYLRKENIPIEPQIVFNYLGEFRTGRSNDDKNLFFEFKGNYHGKEIASDQERSHVLDLNIVIVKGKLRVTLSYGRKQFKQETMDKLLDVYERTLQSFIVLAKPELAVLNSNEREDIYFDLTPAQKRIWIACQFTEKQTAYNINQVYEIEGSLDLECLESAFRDVLERHESLRTNFFMINGEPKQKVSKIENIVTGIFYNDSISSQNSPEFVKQAIEEELNFIFNIATDLLIRIRIEKLQDQKYLWAITMHHIILDRWSLNIFFEELISLYYAKIHNQRIVLAKPVQYKEYIHWLNQQLSGEKLSTLKTFWGNKLKDQLPYLLPKTDYPRAGVTENKGLKVDFELTGELKNKLDNFRKDKKISIFTVILSIYKLLLYKYSGQKDIIIGYPIAGRLVKDFEGCIGLFLNTLPLRTKIKDTDSYRDFLGQIKLDLFDSFSHQLYPFEMLVDDLKLERQNNQNPLFDIGLTWLNTQEIQKRGQSDGLLINEVKTEQVFVKHELWLYGIESPGSISLSLHFNCALYKRERIEEMMENIKLILSLVLDNKNLTIHDIVSEMLYADEDRDLGLLGLKFNEQLDEDF